VAIISAICFLAARLFGRSIRQLVLRTIGLVLLTVAASISFYRLWPGKVYYFPIGSGGILGVGAAYFFHQHLALLGTAILIVAMWLVGLVLVADSLLIAMLNRILFAVRRMGGMASPAWSAAKQQSEVLNEIWRKLSARQASAGGGACGASWQTFQGSGENRAGQGSGETDSDKVRRRVGWLQRYRNGDELRRLHTSAFGVAG